MPTKDISYRNKGVENSMPNTKCCERNDLMYTSNPPQNKCKNCGKFWFCKDPTPICDASVSHQVKGWEDLLLDLFNKYDKEIGSFEVEEALKSFIANLLEEAEKRGRKKGWKECEEVNKF